MDQKARPDQIERVPEVTREIIAVEPIDEKTSTEELTETLVDGTTLRKKITTVRIIRKIIERVTTDGVEEIVETIQPPESNITEEVTEIPPGTDLGRAEPVSTKEEHFEETLDDGQVIKRHIITTLVESPPEAVVDREVLGVEPTGQTTDIQETAEQLNDGTLLRKRIITTTTTKKVIERVMTDGVPQIVESPAPSDFDITEEVTEIPPGTDESRAVPLASSQEVQEETLPDGSHVRRTTITTQVQAKEPEVTREVLGIEPAGETTQVQETTEELPDGTLLRKRTTTVTTAKKVLESVVTDGVQQIVESPAPSDLNITEEVTEIPAGTDEGRMVPVGTPTEQVKEETLPDGSHVKKTLITTKVKTYEPEVTTEILGEEPAEVSTDVQESSETLPDGTILRKKTTTKTIGKKVTEKVVTDGVPEIVERPGVPDLDITEEVTEIPPGTDESRTKPVGTSEQVKEETLPDGSHVKKTTITTKVETREPEITREVLGVEPVGESTDVQETTDNLPDGTLLRKKITTVTVAKKTVEKVVTDGVPEIVESPAPSDLRVTEEVTEIPPGTDESKAVPVGKSEQIREETLPDGSHVKKTIITTKVQTGEPEVTTEVLSVEPIGETADVQESSETLPDGTILRKKTTTVTKAKKVTEKVITDGVPEVVERVGAPDLDITEEVTEVPPGTDETRTKPVSTSEHVKEETLPDGAHVKKTTITTKVETREPEVTTEVMGTEPAGESTDVQETSEALPDGTILRKRTTTVTKAKKTIEKVITDGVPEIVEKPAPSDFDITEEVTEIPPGTDETRTEPVGKSEQVKEETLPDGSHVKRTTITTKVQTREPEVVTEVLGVEPAGESTDVQETSETLPDGTVLKKKVTTVTIAKKITEKVITDGIPEVVERSGPPDLDITEDVTEIPPGTDETKTTPVGKSEQVKEETLPDGSHIKRTTITTKVQTREPEVTKEVLGVEPVGESTDVQETSETLPDGTVLKKKTTTVTTAKKILEKVITDGVEEVVERPGPSDLNVTEEVTEIPLGTDENKTEPVSVSEKVREQNLPDGSHVKTTTITTKVQTRAPEVTKEVLGTEPTGESTDVQESSETLPDGTVLKKITTTVTMTKKLLEKVVTDGVEEIVESPGPSDLNIIEAVTEIPPGVDENKTEPVSVKEQVKEERCRDGSHVKTTTITTKVRTRAPEVTKEFLGTEPTGSSTDVQETSETLPDGTILKKKTTTVTSTTKVLQKVITDGVPETVELPGPSDIDITEDVTEIPPGVNPEKIEPVSINEQVREQSLPDGSRVKTTTLTTKVKTREPEVVKEVLGTEPSGSSTDVQETSETLPDGTILKKKTTTVTSTTKVFQKVITDGVPETVELPGPSDIDITEDVTEIPPGVNPERIEPVSINEQVREQTLPDGSRVKTTTLTTKVKTREPEVVKEVLGTEPTGSSTDVQETSETLPDGTILKKKTTTVTSTTKVLQKVITDGVPETVELPGPSDIDITEDVTEIPPGVNPERIEPVSINEQVREQTLPDGSRVKTTTLTTKVQTREPSVFKEVLSTEPAGESTDVQEATETLSDGTILRKKITTVTTNTVVKEKVITDGVPEVVEVPGPSNLDITEDITEIPPGTDESRTTPVSTREQMKQETRPDGSVIKTTTITTKVKTREPEVTREIVGIEPAGETSDVKETVDTLDNGTLLKKKTTTVTTAKKIVEKVITDGVEEIVETPGPSDMIVLEEVTEIPAGTDESRAVPVSTNEQVREETRTDGSYVKTTTVTTKVQSRAPAITREILAVEPIGEEVDTKETTETLDDGTRVRRKSTTVTVSQKILEKVVTDGQPVVEEKQGPSQVSITDDVTVIPPGVDEAKSAPASKREEVKEQTLPDGSVVRTTTFTTTLTHHQPDVQKQVLAVEPTGESTDTKEFTETLDDGTVLKKKVTTVTITKKSVESVTTDGVQEIVESPAPSDVNVTEEVTEIPPGIDETNAVPISTKEVSKEETLPNGSFVSTRTVHTVVQSPAAADLPRQLVGIAPVKQTTDVQESTETLPDGTVLRKKTTTQKTLNKKIELVTINGVEQTVESAAPSDISILEDVTEIPPGTQESMAQPLSTKEVEKAETLPDGSTVKTTTVTTRIGTPGDQISRVPEVTKEIISIEPISQSTDVQELSERLRDGTLLKKKITTVRIVNKITECITTEGVREIIEYTSPELDIKEDISEFPPGVNENLSRPVSTSEQKTQENLDDGTLVKRQVITTKYASTASGDLAGFQQGQISLMPGALLAPGEQQVQNYEETLPDGTVVKRRVVITREGNILVKRIITEMPNGEILEDVVREEFHDQIVPEDAGSLQQSMPYDGEVADIFAGGQKAIHQTSPDTIEEEVEEVLPDGTVVRRKIIKTRVKKVVRRVVRQGPDGQLYEEEVPEGEDIPGFGQGERPVGFKEMPGSTVIAGPPETTEIQETLPDGTVVTRRVEKTRERRMVKRIVREGPDGELIEEEVEVPEGQGYQDHIVGGLTPSDVDLLSPESLDDDDASRIRVYTDTIEGDPQTETETQEFEETLPDGTIVKRKVIKTKQRQTVIKRVVMEGPEGELPPEEEMRQYADTVAAAPETDTDVQEFEETLEDGTVVKRKIVTTREQQIVTEREVLEGGGEVPALPVDDMMVQQRQGTQEWTPFEDEISATQAARPAESAPHFPDQQGSTSSSSKHEQPLSPSVFASAKHQHKM